MSDVENIKIEEYRSLLEEHRRNRSYIFERPIIVLGLIAIAIQYVYGSPIGQFVLVALIFILCFNLWFTGNRLLSDARIVAYIHLIHEGELKSKYFGWESALREYRKWNKIHTRLKDKDNLVKEKINPDYIPDKLMFYPAIWFFHFCIVLLILVITSLSWWDSKTAISSVGLGLSIIATLFFIAYAMGRFHPNRLKGSIEVQREIWLCVFEELQG
jgi:hypothetical protein